MNQFYRFPHTPHIAWLGEGDSRKDKILSLQELSELLTGEVVVEEKIDGANIGFSLDENGSLQVQNRGAYLEQPYRGQFSRLNGWLGQFSYKLKIHLPDDIIVFGEWCAARHTLPYDHLPDYFLLFDLYDKKEKKFWSVCRRNEWAKKIGMHTVPSIERGRFSPDRLQDLLIHTRSAFRDGHVEGLVVRNDDLQWNQKRGKLVRADFVQAMDTHWSRKQLEWNALAAST